MKTYSYLSSYLYSIIFYNLYEYLIKYIYFVNSLIYCAAIHYIIYVKIIFETLS